MDPDPALMPLASGLPVERRAFRRAKRRTIELLLDRFRHAIEAVGDDLFWDSRGANRLKMKPESIAQAALALTVKVLVEGRVDVLREFKVGTGYADVGIFLSKLHIVELKILKSGQLIGPQQLDDYLRCWGQKKGWLVIVDARRPSKKKMLIPNTIQLTGGRVAHVVTIDINPVAPSRIAA